ncbi:MAG: PEP-CTERM system histidine kinase PrsK [Gammaproteobacteria bacterium]|nr:PEP-CTERM system histidine kinase PrsK [Gammaproteobacteria bacterium]
MDFSLPIVSHSIGAIGFLYLGFSAIAGWGRRDSGRALIIAAFITAAWSASIAAQSLWGIPSFTVRFTLEGLRNLSWAFLLLRILGLKMDSVRTSEGRVLFFLALIACLVTLLPLFFRFLSDIPEMILTKLLFGSKAQLVWQIAYTILGLILIEQILRNTRVESRWQIKFLCLALGLIIGYDFFLYSHALLYSDINASLWGSRGFVNFLAIPLIRISSNRNRTGPMNLNLSRDFTFHSTIFLGAGFYLILMAAAAYYIKSFNSDWGGALQIVFLTLGGLLLFILVFSGSLRARLRVFLSQHLFSYKYDYRKEWLRITDILSETNEERPLPERAVYAMARIVGSQGGALWLADQEQNFYFQLAISMPRPPETQLPRSEPMLKFLSKNKWVIDLNELKEDPDLYGHLPVPDWLNQQREAWLITPLMLHDTLYGFIILNKSRTVETLNWEDHDIIKVAGRQVASAIAQQEAASALAKASEFDAFHQMSAFIVHDIKTLVSQLSLLVSNAEKHKTNPAFIDDMIKTTDHSVNKMTRLLGQLSETRPDKSPQETLSNVELNTLLRQLSDNHQNREPTPVFIQHNKSITVQANKEKLLNVLSHLVKNAQEACDISDTINIKISSDMEEATITLSDTGSGMSQSFIDTELFQPFKSTKGVSGMGIGVYQCQEYIKTLNGRIHVDSQLGKGSVFTLTLPLTKN